MLWRRVAGSVFTRPSIPTWYAHLTKPSWSPPNWIFGPVWTALYAMMAIAAWLVWLRRGDTDVTMALVLFGVQLALNIAWSAIFFGLHRPGAAFVEILLLWLAILAATVEFSTIARPAAWLMVPYLVWVSFASLLNGTLWRLNHS